MTFFKTENGTIHHQEKKLLRQIFNSVGDFTTILVVADIVIIVVNILVVRGKGGDHLCILTCKYLITATELGWPVNQILQR